MTTFFYRPGLLDFTWIFIFATSSFGNVQLRLRLREEKRVLLWAVPAKTTSFHTATLLESGSSGREALEDSLLLGSC